MSLLRGSTQILDASITRVKTSLDFLNASDWNITNGSNNATITGLSAGVNANDAVNFAQFEAGLSGLDFQPDVLDVQTDATLDPGAAPTTGDRYIITDAGALHANFGTIAGVGNNDIVEYDGTNFIVAYDVSVEGEGALVWDQNSNTYQRYDGTDWSEFGGLSGVTAGAGLSKTLNTLDITATDLSMLINADDIQVNIGTTNGTSLEVSATGLEIPATITGARAFTTGNAAFSIDSGTANVGITGSLINLTDAEITAATVSTAIPLAVQTTVDHGTGTASGALINDFRTAFTDEAILNAIMENKTAIDNNVGTVEEVNKVTTLTVASQIATLTVAPTTGVTKLKVYLNGNRVIPTSEYTITNAVTGEITFTAAQVLTAGDVVMMDYVDA